MIGLVPDLIPESQVGRANGLIAMLSVMGAVFGFCLWWATVGQVELMYVFYILLLMGSLCISCAAVQEKQQSESSLAPLTWAEIRASFWVSPSEHRDFFYVFVSRTCYYMGISSQTFMLYFLRDMLGVANPEAMVGVVAVTGKSFLPVSHSHFCSFTIHPLLLLAPQMVNFKVYSFGCFRPNLWDADCLSSWSSV